MAALVQVPPEDYDLQQGWSDVLQTFAKTTKIELQPDHVMSPEDVIGQLKSKRDKDSADSAKYRAAKDVLGKTLACIQTLGGIAASGASMVFGPANLCYSGLNYLITAGQNYSNIFSSLEGLLKQVSDVLERMVVYLKMKDVDRPLRKIVHELLQNIISIFALSIKVLHGNKILKFLKVFAFQEDDGVKGALGALQALVDRESQMKTTLTYAMVKEGLSDANEAVLGVRSVVDRIADEGKKRDLESLDRKQLEKIRVALGGQTGFEQQTKLHSRLWSETVPETGEWLQNETDFTKWADRTTSFNKLIFLSADEGYGKTFLVTSVVHSLYKRYSRQIEDPTRTMVAYYHLLPKETKSTHGTDIEVFSVEKILKTIALQFAQDPVYRKDIMTHCENWIEPETIEELFTRLMDPCYKSSEIFYVLIDGIDLASERELSGLAQLLKTVSTRFTPEQQSHVRILFSGRVSLVNSLATELEHPSTVIDVASKNRPDIEKFTRDRLCTLKLLQGETEPLKAMRQEVFDVLTTEARGDFVNIELLLKEISTKQWPAEIRGVLANAKAGKNRSDTIAREIARCNDTLSAQEIRDLNAMLLWVLNSKQPLKVSTLSGVLFLKNNESSLRPLHERIREKYSSFFQLDEVYGSAGESGYLVSLVSESIRDYFKSQDADLVLQSPGHDKVQESEVKIVRRFLASVCDEELYVRLGFDEFFAQRLNNTSVMIDVDLERASSTLLLGSLQALDSTAPELREVWLYAVDQFCAHLEDVDLAMTDPAIKMAIGKLLISLFTEEKSIAKWWTSETFLRRRYWFYQDDHVDAVLNWFKDSAVTKGLSHTNKEWVKSLTSNASPNSDLLEHITTHLCKELYLSPSTFAVRQLYSAIAAYRLKIKHRSDNSVERITEDFDEDEDVSCEEIIETSKWAATVLSVDFDTDYQFVRCTGRLLRVYKLLDDAVSYYKKAIRLSDDNYWAQVGLANAYSDQGLPQNAIEIGEKLKDQLQNGAPKAVENLEEAKVNLRRSLASWYRQGKRFDEALSIFKEGITADPNNYWLYYQKILLFGATDQHEQVWDLLHELGGQLDTFSGISRRSRLLHLFTPTEDLLESLQMSGKASGKLSLLVSALRQAAEDAVNPLYVPLATVVKEIWRANATIDADAISWYIARTDEQKAAMVEVLEKRFKEHGAAGYNDARAFVASRLAPVYVDRLKRLAPDSLETQTTLQQLSELAFDDNVDDQSVDTRLLMARYESLRGNRESAMKLTRGGVKIGLDLLSDEDPDNDYLGYQRLAAVLMFAGDDDNALAAWSLLGPAEEDDKHDVPTDDKTADEHVNSEDLKSADEAATAAERAQDEPSGPLLYYCDGDCDPNTSWTYANDMYSCKDCLDVMFDEQCLRTLKEGSLSTNVCNSSHEFLHVPKWDPEEAAERGKDHVRLRGEQIPVADWLNELRTRWGFEEAAAQGEETTKDEGASNGQAS